MSNFDMDKSPFPLGDMQGAYFVGEQCGLPLATVAKYYREVEFDAFTIAEVQNAWNTLLNRHDMLRAIVLEDGSQQILDVVEKYHICYHDLSGISDNERYSIYESIRSSLIEKELPLNRFPQFSVQLSRNGNRMRLHIRVNIWVVDAVSMQILLSELIQLCQHPAAPLPAVKGSYRKYIASLSSEKYAEYASRSRTYWFDRIATLPLGPDLPIKTSTNNVGKPIFGHLARVVSASTWSKFVVNAQAFHITPSTAVLAAYAATLARWSKRKHFTITLLLSTRPFAGSNAEGVVGNFGTTLLLEVDIRSKQTFKDLARYIQKQLWQDIRHISISGIEVAREINRFHETPFGLVAPVTFTSLMSGWDTSIGKEQTLKQMTHRLSHLDVPQVYLDHQVVEEPQGHLTVNWDFVQGMFYEGVVEDMLDTQMQLLESLAVNKLVWDSNTSLKLPDYHNRIHDLYNRTEKQYGDYFLDEFVRKKITNYPHNTAIINGGTTLSYEELGEKSKYLCRSLESFDIEDGELIAVVIPKGWRQIVAVLGITMTGAAYVPIDPNLPTLRRNQIVDQAQITKIITTKSLAEDLEWGKDVNLICIDDLPTPVSIPKNNTRPRSFTDTAYVIFTSGSTGMPKGVVISHTGAMNTILDINNRLNICSDDKVLSLSSLSFDLSVYDIFGILGAGGQIVIPTKDEEQNPDAWCKLINDTAITLWNSVPALFQLAVDTSIQEGYSLTSLKNIMLSGDWIPVMLPEKGKSIAKNARIFSLGGATEASIWSIIHEIEKLDESWKTIPYGNPLSNQQLYILDDSLDLCPIWSTGEIYIGGKGVAKGYLNDNQRTSKSFVHNPFTKQRLYRTGDMARMRPEGIMEFLGREDDQVKIRGFRIELGDIESTLLAKLPVAKATVKVFGYSNADKMLISFVVRFVTSTVSEIEMKNILSEFLPQYMIPEYIHIVEEIPLTFNGKIDNHGLESIHKARRMARNYDNNRIREKATSSITSTVINVWEQILRHRIDTDISFFALGGTSFQALQLIAKIRERFRVRFSLNSISSGMTVNQMATQLSRQSTEPLKEEPLLLLQNGTDSMAKGIFCIHPVGGSTHCYIQLVNFIKPGVSIFGIQSTSMLLDEADEWTIEALADRYVELIQSAFPKGSCILIGWSLGGAIAFEIARRLIALSRKVDFVGLIDPFCTDPNSKQFSTSLDILLAFGHDLAGLNGVTLQLDKRRLEELSTLDNESMFKEYVNELVKYSILPENPPIDELKYAFHIFKKNTEALLKYNPAPLEFIVTVFQANIDVYSADGRLKRWEPQGIATHVYEIPSDHFTIMEAPAIETIAGEVNKLIDE